MEFNMMKKCKKTKDCDWTWSICNIPFQWSCFSQKHLDPIVWQTSVKTTMDYGSILESSELKLMFDSETNIPARKELIFLTQSKKTENGTTVAFPWNEIGTNIKCTNLFWKMSKKTNNIHFIFDPCVKYISLWHQPTWYYFLTPVLFPTQILSLNNCTKSCGF